MPLLVSTASGLYTLNGAGPTLFDERHDFLALARRERHRDLCYAARTDGHVYRSTDGGSTWEPTGQIDGFEELSSLAVDHENPNALLAGMEPAALFRSRDGGRSWEEDARIREMSRKNGWSVPWSDAPGHVRTLAIDPSDPRRIYLAIEVGGVVRTEDGGATWENVHGGVHDDVHSVAVCPDKGRVVYAATRHGFGRSSDYGRTWRQIGTFEGQGYSRPLAVDPRRAGRLFTAASNVGPGGFSRPEGSECGVFRSEDGGDTWTRLTDGLEAHFGPYVESIDVNPYDPRQVALGLTDGRLFTSYDSGTSWRLATTLPRIRRVLFVA